MAEKAGRTAGYLLVYTAAGEAEIARIAVVKELQRQGVARALLAELESVCGSEGIKRSSWMCAAEMLRQEHSMLRWALRRTAFVSGFMKIRWKTRSS